MTDQLISAYKFTSTNEPIPLTIGDSVYSVELYSGFLCRADAVEALSGQTVTLTVSTEPLVTTEAEYDGGIIFAHAAGLIRYMYEASRTTSECYGGYCPDGLSNPLAAPTPTPTPAPTGTYVPPPSHPTTQFSPAPSCLGDSNLWLVSTSCHVLAGQEIAKPSWLECAITELGEPDVYNKECYRRGSATAGDDGTTSFYVGCPAGYTTASESTYRPFDERQYGDTSREAKSYDVVASVVMCCPDGDYSFQYSDVLTTTTTYDYRQQLVDMYPMPLCVATSVQTLSGRDVELTLTEDDRAWDKKKRQEETAGPAVTTRPWDYEGGLLFAQVAQAEVTVFHGTYSCLEACDDYFTYSYNNTDPNYTPTSTAPSEEEATKGPGASRTSPSEGEATQISGATNSIGSPLLGLSRGTVLAVAFLTVLYRTVL